MEHTLTLAGCTPTPLAHYLKALGIFRLLAEQKDPDLRARWHKDQLQLQTRLSREEVTQFFLLAYRPTPILSPWNGRAGYLEGEDEDDSTRKGAILLKLFRDSSALRLEGYRNLISFFDGLPELSERNTVRAQKKELEKEKKAKPSEWTDDKQSQLATAIKREEFLKNQVFSILRNALPDNQLNWIDAVISLGENNAYSPLFGGSGGVEGSMDLGVNFMDNLINIICFEGKALPSNHMTHSWLRNSLFDESTLLTAKNTAGSLAPGRVGGHNATSGFSQYLTINPWDYILMVEGAMVFRPSLTKKLENSGVSRISYPFTVEPTAIGGGAIVLNDKTNTRSGNSEIWMPLWSASVTFDELSSLLREGNIRSGRNTPKDGLGMAQSIAKLGIDRGISGFQRFVFLKRSGDSDLAIPLSRQDVSRNTSPAAELITDIESNGFLRYLREVAQKDTSSISLKRAISLLENALFALTRPGAGRSVIQHCLIQLGAVVQVLAAQVLASSRKGQEAVQGLPQALPHLRAHWVTQADDGSSEFRLALALAGLNDLPAYLAPVSRNKAHPRRWNWFNDSRLYVWGKGDPVRNLARVVERRVLEASRPESQSHEPFAAYLKVAAEPRAVADFLAGRTDDARLAALLHGLIWAELPEQGLPALPAEVVPLPAAYPILKPFFTPASALSHAGRLPEDARLPLPGNYTRWLLAQRSDEAIQHAWRRGRIAGLDWPTARAPASPQLDGPRLLAALAIPLNSSGLKQLLPKAAEAEAPAV